MAVAHPIFAEQFLPTTTMLPHSQSSRARWLVGRMGGLPSRQRQILFSVLREPCSTRGSCSSRRSLRSEGRLQESRDAGQNCAIVVLNDRVVSSSSGFLRNSSERTSIPQGPSYPAFRTQSTKPLTSNS